MEEKLKKSVEQCVFPSIYYLLTPYIYLVTTFSNTLAEFLAYSCKKMSTLMPAARFQIPH